MRIAIFFHFSGYHQLGRKPEISSRKPELIEQKCCTGLEVASDAVAGGWELQKGPVARQHKAGRLKESRLQGILCFLAIPPKKNLYILLTALSKK